MGSCLPKFHELICNQYTPSFTPGTTPCTLPYFDDYRAFVQAGGSFFRAIEIGSGGNNINLKSTWLQNGLGDDGLPGGVRTETTDPSLVHSVELVITKTGSPTITETFYGRQQQGTVGSPEGTGWVFNAIPHLRELLNNYSNLVTMPEIHHKESWGTGSPPGLDDDHLATFDTNLGGVTDSTPDTLFSGIRTGPVYTLIHTAHTESKDLAGTDFIIGTRAGDITGGTAGYQDINLISGSPEITLTTPTNYPKPTYGYQEIILNGSPEITLSSATGFSSTSGPVAGYQIVDLGGSPEVTSTSSTGLSLATTYAATILVDGTYNRSISLNGTNAQTYQDLLNEINADLSTYATATLESGNIKVTSNNPGFSSAIDITDITLFSALTAFLSILTAVPGDDVQVLTVTYDIDSPVSYSVNTTINGYENLTYNDFVTTLQTLSAGNAVASLVNNTIKIESNTLGANSNITITVTDALTTLTAYNSLGTSVAGHEYTLFVSVDVTPYIKSYSFSLYPYQITTYGDLINEINNVIGLRATISLFSSNILRIESNLLGSDSKISIVSGDMFSDLPTYSSLGAEILGISAIVDSGYNAVVGVTKMWNGTAWEPFDPNSPVCYNPLDPGSWPVGLCS